MKKYFNEKDLKNIENIGTIGKKIRQVLFNMFNPENYPNVDLYYMQTVLNPEQRNTFIKIINMPKNIVNSKELQNYIQELKNK
jgi:hypothetical protein